MRTKKLPRILFFSVITIVTLFIAASIFVPLILNNKIKDKLEEAVATQSHGKYILHIDKVNISLFSSALHVSGLKLTPVKEKRPPAATYAVSAAEVNFIGFKIWSYITNKDLTISTLEIKESAASVYKNKETKKSTPDSTKKQSVYSVIKKSLHSISVADIRINNANIKIYDNPDDSLPVTSTSENQLIVTNFTINEKAEQQQRAFLSDTFQLILKRFSITTANNLSTFSIRKITASYNDSTFILDSIQLTPNYSKKEFGAKAGHQTDRIVISIGKASFEKMNMKALFEKSSFEAELLRITDFDLEAYRDKNDPPIIKTAISLQQKLKQLPVTTNIGKVYINNMNIVYEEVAKDAPEPGIITFNKLNGTVTGLTSNPSLYGKEKLELRAVCQFMNTTKLQAYYIFPLNTDQMVFDCGGRLNEMPLSVINKILTPNAHLLIKNGTVDSAVLAFHADQEGAVGTMSTSYHDLKIELLKKDNNHGPYEGLLSLLFRIIFIKKDNPKKNRDVRTSEINYKYDQKRFIFSYSWQAILSGIKPTIGIPNKVMKKKKKSS